MKITYNRKWRVGKKKFATKQEAQDYVDSTKKADNWTLAEETSSMIVSTPTLDFFGSPSSPTSNY